MVLYRLSGAPSEYSGTSTPSGPVPPLPTNPTATSGLTASSTVGSQHALLPPNRSFAFGAGHSNRDSIASSSGDSIISLDSKYPAFHPSNSSPHSLAALGAGMGTVGGIPARSATGTSSASGSVRGLVPYAYNPLEDDDGDDDEVDWLHDPDAGYPKEKTPAGGVAHGTGGAKSRLGPAGAAAAAAAGAAAATSQKIRAKIRPPPGTPGVATKTFPLRGVVNVGVLVLLILGLLCLFILYPVIIFKRDERFTQSVIGNIRINGTGEFFLLVLWFSCE
jgi:hypothetical protein